MSAGASDDEMGIEKVDSAPNELSGPQVDGRSDDGLNKTPFFVVGVGASAGGLEALSALFKDIHLERMAVIVVQHLAPTHDSVLPALLQRSSRIPAKAAEDGMRLEPNNIYVIPPNADLAIADGTLRVSAPVPHHGTHLPIDFFFRSLARDQGARAIGVVLSGTGSDGTFGLQAIKEAGGIAMVQDPTSAKYDGMPRSALDAGWADLSLPPEGLARELSSMTEGPFLLRAASAPRPQSQEGFGRILFLIRAQFGNDLTYYKPTTIERRIERRMTLHKLDRLEAYQKFLQGNAEELRALYKDILINVTSFFRDREPFEVLRTKILPQMLERRPPTEPLRIWVPACATGEEAYSLAICVLEALGDRSPEFRIQIFGTDVDEASVQYARRAVYPQNIALDVSPDRLQRFFVQKDKEYQVSRRIRDMVVFSTQNVTKDAPFSRLDLVSCRNLLIYLQPVMQKKVLRILHYALKPTGILLLGNSETVGDSPDLFSLIDRKNKLYSPKHLPAVPLDIGFGAQSYEANLPSHPRNSRPVVNLAALADRKILEMYGPPGVVINENLEVLHFRGRTGPYLEPAPGAASLSILRLARPDLHVDLRRAIHQALTDNASVSADCRIHEDGKVRQFKLEVVPIVEPDTKARCLLVLFHEPSLDAHVTSRPVPPAEHVSASEQRVQEIERELTLTKEYLQSTIEELESSNEELKSSNEELQSSNEELQSTNEELETSKEELQSSNEELTTVNDELHTRMMELQITNDDLHNVLTGIDNIVVITGLELRIRRYTFAAEKLFNLVPADLGRSVSQLNNFFKGERFEKMAASVIDTLAPVVKEVFATDNRWYSLRITPYKTLEHSISGVVISVMDIDAKKRSAQLGREVSAYAVSFLDMVSHPLVIVDGGKRVVWANRPFFEAFGRQPEETIDKQLEEIASGQWADRALFGQVDECVRTGVAFQGVTVHFAFNDGVRKTVALSGSRLPPLGGAGDLVLLAMELV